MFSRSGTVERVKLETFRQVDTQPMESSKGWLLVDPKPVGYESGRIYFLRDSPVDELEISVIDVVCHERLGWAAATLRSEGGMARIMDWMGSSESPGFLDSAIPKPFVGDHNAKRKRLRISTCT